MADFEVPGICWQCHRLEEDYNAFSETTIYYCAINLWWPRRGRCKKRVPPQEESR